MTKTNEIHRRDFLKVSTLGVVGAGVMGNDLLHSEEKEPQSSSPKIKSYRPLGRTGFKASDIGIGSSRAFSVPVLTALLDSGVNYIDTAESYGRGASETAVGQAIKGRNRKSLFITSKLHITESTGKEEILTRYRKCLDRLKTDYIDCLLLHGASSKGVLNNEGFHQAVKQLKSESKLRFIGVSNHGSRNSENPHEHMEKILMEAVKDGRFDLLLLVYNFIQKEAGQRIMKACKEKNIATTIMKSNPIGRYYTTKERIEKLKAEGKEIDGRTKKYMERVQGTVTKAQEFLKKNNLSKPAEITLAALRFILKNPDVNVLTLAFRSFEDVDNYLKLSGGTMSGGDKKVLAAFQEGFGQFYCRHACGVCESSCPHQVPVNTIMRYNHYFEANNAEKFAMEKYMNLSTARADMCGNCAGMCEQSCPHGVPAKALLTLAHQQLSLA